MTADRGGGPPPGGKRRSSPFVVDEVLLEGARDRLARRPGLRFVVGGAGTGKSTCCAALGARHRAEVLDMDARLYGTYHARFDPARHPASSAWSRSADPLGWQLGLGWEGYWSFQAAATVEGLSLLADELEERPDRPPDWLLIVDGGFARPSVLCRAVPAGRIACLALPRPMRSTVWTATPERAEMLAIVAAVGSLDDPVGRFLEIDARLSAAMAREAAAAGIRVFRRSGSTSVARLAARVARHLGVG